MQIQSRNLDGSFLSKKTTRTRKHTLENDLKAVRAKKLSLLSTTWRKSLSLLQHDKNIVINTTSRPSDCQINVQIIGKERHRRQTRHSAGYSARSCKNVYNQFKLQSYKYITYDAFAMHNFTAPTSAKQSLLT